MKKVISKVRNRAFKKRYQDVTSDNLSTEFVIFPMPVISCCRCGFKISCFNSDVLVKRAVDEGWKVALKIGKPICKECLEKECFKDD